jgi:hypothetical protein
MTRKLPKRGLPADRRDGRTVSTAVHLTRDLHPVRALKRNHLGGHSHCFLRAAFFPVSELELMRSGTLPIRIFGLLRQRACI